MEGFMKGGHGMLTVFASQSLRFVGGLILRFGRGREDKMREMGMD